MKQIKINLENDKLVAEFMKIEIKKKLYNKSSEKILNDLGIEVVKGG